MQKREANAASARIYHSTGENSSSQSSHVPSEGRSVATHTHTHKRKSSRNTRSGQKTHLTSERIKQFRADEAIEGEQTALSRLSEVEFHTGLLLEEQREYNSVSSGHMSHRRTSVHLDYCFVLFRKV